MIEKLKIYRKTISVLLALFAIALTFFADETYANVNGAKQVSQNEHYELYVDEKTTVVSVLVKSTGKVWSTNPDEDFLQTISNEYVKSRLSQQIELKYFDSKDREIALSNYTDSIAKEQFVINQIPNGIEIVYEIGTKEALQIAPKVFRVETFDTLLEQMEEEDREYIQRQYILSDYNAMSEKRQAEASKDYPSIVKENLYTIRELTPEPEKAVPVRIRRRIDEIMKKYGFTVDDLFAEYAAVGHEANEVLQALFVVPVEYTLNEKGLSAKIETGKIQYESDSFYLNTISFLRFFGATESTDGYMFIPDGSGAIVNFDEATALTYNRELYGIDSSFQNKVFQDYSNQSTMPVYGIKHTTDAFLAIIQEGAGNASVMALTANSADGLCNVSPVFYYLSRESYVLDNIKSKELLKFSQKPMESDIAVQYVFLTGDDANYSGMARAYRDILFEGRELLSPQSGDVPLFIESIGAIRGLSKFLGFNVWRDISVTSYKQVNSIVDSFNAKGITNILYKYSSWANGSAGNTYYSTGINYNTVLGSKKDFADIGQHTQDNNWRFLPNAELMYVENDRLFDGFTGLLDSAKDLSGATAMRYNIDVAMLVQRLAENIMIIKPSKLFGYTTSFMKSYSKLPVNGISIESMGSSLNSDFTKNAEITRSGAISIITESLQAIKESGNIVSVDIGNSYALPYADVVFNVPSTSSAYDIETRMVPFVQIVLHGYVEFSGEAINLSGDPKVSFLRAVEQGAGLHYFLNYESDSIFKNTYFAKYYSTNYAQWESRIAESYNRYNEDYQGLAGVAIYSHNQLTENVFETMYDNGVRFIVNYSEKDYEDVVSGKTVKSMDYIAVK